VSGVPPPKVVAPPPGDACHHFREIIKIVASRAQILRLKCTKFYFGLTGGAYSAPQTLWLDLKGLLLKGGMGREREGRKCRVPPPTF